VTLLQFSNLAKDYPLSLVEGASHLVVRPPPLPAEIDQRKTTALSSRWLGRPGFLEILPPLRVACRLSASLNVLLGLSLTFDCLVARMESYFRLSPIREFVFVSIARDGIVQLVS
jgi:hypothetical protein